MNPSPLQLERHFFTKVLIEASSNGKLGTANQVSCEVEIGQALEEAKRFQVILRLKLSSTPDGEACYTGEIHVVGLFQVLEGWPAEKALSLVESNGPALLYGAARELLCNLTSRGPWPQVVLGSVSFIPAKTEKPVVAAANIQSAIARPKRRFKLD